MNETMAIRTMAPINDGMMKNPPTSGPNPWKNMLPNHEPTKPAMILPITPPGMSRPIIKPATQPIRPPTIIDQIMSINSY